MQKQVDVIKKVQPVKESLRIALIYGVFGCLWILLSDKFIEHRFDDPTVLTTIQTFKGWLYAIITTLLIFVSIWKRLILYRNSLIQLNDSYNSLEEAQKRYELAVDGVNDAIWDWNIDDDQYYLSPKWQEKIMGSSQRKLSFQDWMTYIHEDDKAHFLKYINQFKNKKEVHYHNLFRIRCQNHQVFWLYSHGKAIFNEKGEVIRIAGSHTDVSKQIQLQEEIKKSNDLIQKVFDHSSNYIVLWNNKGNIIDMNPQVKKTFKMDRLKNSDFFGMFFPKWDEKQKEMMINSISSKDSFVIEGHIEDEDINKFILWTNNILYQENEHIQFLSIGTDISQLTLIKKELNTLVYYDKLTTLPNRYLFQQQIQDLIMEDIPFALICADIDDIKHINDTLGHIAGDVLIQKIGHKLKKNILKPHFVSRFSGDEFLIVLVNINKEKIMDIVEKYYQKLKNRWYYQSQEYYVTASIGIALYPEHGCDYDTLFKNADTAMYYAKEAGKDSIFLFQYEMNQKNNHYLTTASLLKKAIELKEFVVYYQPLVDLKTLKLKGVEALIRWKHGDRIISPNEFIDIALQAGLINEIDSYVFNQVCKQYKKWYDAGYQDIIYSINISSKRLNHKRLIQDIKETIDIYGLNPKMIQLEITETTILENLETTHQVLNQLHHMGFSIALDDFGTGFSSLTYLKDLTVDVVKIDQDFVKDMSQKDEDQIFIKSIIELAHGLKKTVTAEGIETRQQLNILREHHCDIGQGYFFQKAVSSKIIEDFLINNQIFK